MKIAAICDVMPCYLVDNYRSFRGTDSLICRIERKVAACSKGGNVCTKLHGVLSQKSLIWRIRGPLSKYLRSKIRSTSFEMFVAMWLWTPFFCDITVRNRAIGAGTSKERTDSTLSSVLRSRNRKYFYIHRASCRCMRMSINTRQAMNV
jgi:hypothetical protein